MVVLIAETEGNCFYIILSILLVWRRSDLFNVSLWITGCVSLHSQMSLHRGYASVPRYVKIGPKICTYSETERLAELH